MAKQIAYGEESRRNLLAGVNRLADGLQTEHQAGRENEPSRPDVVATGYSQSNS